MLTVEVRRSSRILAQGFYPGSKKKVHANAESVGESGFEVLATLSAFAGSLVNVPQGCRCAPNPGLALVNAFGVPDVVKPSAFQVL